MFWKIIGVLLLLWAGYDIYNGYTSLFTAVYRDSDPVLYWSAVSVWLALGLSCFYPTGKYR